MFVRRRRPLMAAAMIGGTAAAAHRAGRRSAEEDQMESDQEYRLQQLEAQQAAAAAPAPAPAAGGTDIASKLQELAQLRDQGILTQEEFEAAKQKVLAG